jgi:hypothetical protein
VREARGDVGTLLLAAVWASACDGEEDAASRPDLTVVTTRTVPRTPSRPPEREVIPGTGTLTAYVSRHKWLRARPGGRRLAGLRRRTEFDSPRILTVVARRGVWLGVLAPELRNGQGGMDPRRPRGAAVAGYSSRTSAPWGSKGTRRMSAPGAARRSASTAPPVCS